MKYSLVITQTAGEETAVTAADAEGGIIGGALVLNYSYDGAAYKLEISENEMAQTRDGDISLFMRFAAGQTTVARLNDGGTGGEFPVCTKRLDVLFDGGDVKAECEFSYGECGESVTLSVAASVMQ